MCGRNLKPSLLLYRVALKYVSFDKKRSKRVSCLIASYQSMKRWHAGTERFLEWSEQPALHSTPSHNAHRRRGRLLYCSADDDHLSKNCKLIRVFCCRCRSWRVARLGLLIAALEKVAGRFRVRRPDAILPTRVQRFLLCTTIESTIQTRFLY